MSLNKELDKEQQGRAVEVLAGMEFGIKLIETSGIGVLIRDYPDGEPVEVERYYLTSKDALTPIIEGLTFQQMYDCCAILGEVIGSYSEVDRFRATAMHWAETLIRMVGRWDWVMTGDAASETEETNKGE